jgi:hypothetical protein
MFGNTEQVARAVAAGLSEHTSADVIRAAVGVVLTDDVELLVVGAPTHAFSMSRPSTRSAAARQGAPAQNVGDAGLREWMNELAAGKTVPAMAAAFDTRIRKRGVPGSAAKAAAKRLRLIGVPMLTAPTSFWVEDTPGPLLVAEEERARLWGADLGRLLTEQTPTRRARGTTDPQPLSR